MRRRLSAHDDEGVSLVELLVYSMLLVGMMALVATVLVRTMWTNHHILMLNEASNQSQTQLESIELAVRNAAAVEVRDGGNLLLVKRRSTLEASPSSGVCSGWYFNPATGNLHAAHDAATGAARSITAASSVAAAASWPVMIEGVSRLGSSQIFAGSTDGVRIEIDVATSRDRKPVQFRTEAVIRASNTIAGTDCW